MRLDHLLSKEHSPRLLVGSELAPGSCPFVVRWVAHWVEHYCVGLAVIFGAGSGLVVGGSVVRTKHTVGCLRQHREHPWLLGVWVVSDGTDSRDARVAGWLGVWVGLVCVV